MNGGPPQVSPAHVAGGQLHLHHSYSKLSHITSYGKQLHTLLGVSILENNPPRGWCHLRKILKSWREKRGKCGRKSSVADPHRHDFGLLDPHTESAFQMQIPDANPATHKIVPKFELLIQSSILTDKIKKFQTCCCFSKIGLLFQFEKF